jgi:hypothetical protein
MCSVQRRLQLSELSSNLAANLYVSQVHNTTGSFLVQNSFPMKEWHVEHMQKTVVKYVKGLSANASGWEKRNHKKYGGLANMCRQIEYDIKHGVALEQVLDMFHKVRNDSSFSELRKGTGSMERLAEVETHFTQPKTVEPRWY